MNRRPISTALLAWTVACACLSACAASGGADRSPPAPATSSSPVASARGQGAPSLVPGPSLAAGDVPEAMVRDVIDQAASGAGVNPADVTLVSAEAVTWSDGSLGCPEEGKGYTQALVDGYRVIVEVGDDRLHFHAARDGEFRFCADPQPPVGG